VRYSDASSSSNNSKEGKDKQKLKRSLSDTDLQRNIDRFKQDVIYKLNNRSIENTSESVDQAKDQSMPEIKKIIKQSAQKIMDKHFSGYPELLATFKQQGVRLLDIGESSSAADTPQHSEEGNSDILPDESIKKDLFATHTSTFDRVFQPAFNHARREENLSAGDALLQAGAHAHQLAYILTSIRAEQLVYKEQATSLTQPEVQSLQELKQQLAQRYQELDDHIKTHYEIEYWKEMMQKEVPHAMQKCTKEFVTEIVKDYIQTIKEMHCYERREPTSQVEEEYKQLSRGECNQQALINHIINAYNSMDEGIYLCIRTYSHSRATYNMESYRGMKKALDRIEDEYLERGVPLEDVQTIVKKNFQSAIEENVKRMKDKYPYILSQCGIAVIPFDDSQFIAD
jgi:hypothetical protein